MIGIILCSYPNALSINYCYTLDLAKYSLTNIFYQNLKYTPDVTQIVLLIP
jgi:hypothetical protein